MVPQQRHAEPARPLRPRHQRPRGRGPAFAAGARRAARARRRRVDAWPRPVRATSTCSSSAATRRDDANCSPRSRPVLQDRRADLRLFRFTAPVRTGAPGLVFGTDKYRLLASAEAPRQHPPRRQASRLLRVGAHGRGDGQRLRGGHRAVRRRRAAAARRALRRDRRPGRHGGRAARATRRGGTRSPPPPPTRCCVAIRCRPRSVRSSSGSTASTSAPAPGSGARPLRSPISEPRRRCCREFRPATALRERVFKALVAERGHRRADRVGAGGVAPRVGRPHHRAHDTGVRARPGRGPRPRSAWW